MRSKWRPDIERFSNSTSISAGYNFRACVSLPGFIQYLQHICCFRGYFLYMDIAPRMERQFHFDLNQCNRECNRRDNFSVSVECMRYKYRKYT